MTATAEATRQHQQRDEDRTLGGGGGGGGSTSAGTTAATPRATAAPPVLESEAEMRARQALALGLVQPAGAERVVLSLHPEMERLGDFHGRKEFACEIHASGVAPKALDTPEKIFAALCIGAELGLAPMYAIRNCAVVNNVASLMFQAQHAVVMASGLLEEYREEVTDEKGRIWVKRKGRPGIWSEFTMAEAERAGLTKPRGERGSPSMYTLYPKRMLRARAGSWGLKQEFPDILAGLYTPEEAEEAGERGEAKPATASPGISWKLTGDAYLIVQRQRAAKKLDKPAYDEIVRAATGGRALAIQDERTGIPDFSREEWGTIEAAVGAWKAPAATGAKPAAPALAPAAPVTYDVIDPRHPDFNRLIPGE